MEGLPVRGPAVRDLVLPLPPDRMPLARGGRPLKRWRYVGVFGPDALLCAAEVHVGPLVQRFWAVALPGGRLVSRTAMLGRGGLRMAGSRVSVRGRLAAFEFDIDEEGGPAAVESVSPSGDQYVWTRKRAGAAMTGTLRVGDAWLPLRGEAMVDETAGYHRRHTAWWWSAGVGRAVDGRPVGWNLVSGVNDDPLASERTVWVAGRPEEVGPADFSDGEVRFGAGGELRLTEWSARAHAVSLGPLRSRYRQPFGTFAGVLPGGLSLAEGYGVMERHEAWW